MCDDMLDLSPSFLNCNITQYAKQQINVPLQFTRKNVLEMQQTFHTLPLCAQQEPSAQ